MVQKFIKSSITALAITTFSALPAAAESLNYLFSISLGVAKIGEMRVRADVNGGQYSTSGSLKSTGIAGALYDVSYEHASAGTYANEWQFNPSRYSSTAVESGETEHTQITYAGNRVSGVTFDPTRDVPASATGQTNTIDPMTLIYLLLRPVSPDHICGGNYTLFDGRNRRQVTYTNPRRFNDGRVECSVSYGGGSSGLALTGVTFVPGNDGMMHISRFSANTNAGTLTAKRR